MCSTTLPSSSRTLNTSSQPIGTQVVLVHPTSEEIPTLQPNRHKSTCVANMRRTSNKFNPINRYTSTCASNIRRTSNTSTQPIGRHTSTCLDNFSEGKRILTHKCKHNLPKYLHTSVNTTCPTQLPTYSDRLYEQQFSLNLHLYNIVLPPLVTTVFTTKPTGWHTRKPASLDDSPTNNGFQHFKPTDMQAHK